MQMDHPNSSSNQKRRVFIRYSETEEQAQQRFQMELEFVNALCNPEYLSYLAQAQYFSDPCFVRYLKYLLYFKQPEYAQFVVYPEALYFLDLLQKEAFRNQLGNSAVSEFIHTQQLWHWKHYRPNRIQENEHPIVSRK
eukprot:GCRY01003289.1.p1 GENE.GCRY01003289.1~~GCRY01003289.1.p1  ORF type:complete len:138 (+),score=4.85 GCRY01003289.1:105-518(+)